MVVHNWWDSFTLTFVPLFIVIDAVGNLPFVIALSEEMTPPERRLMIRNAVITATAVGLFFLFLGQAVLNIMGISVGSFAIGGGIILLILSINFILSDKSYDFSKEEMVAIVPIGTPLTVGPATVTTLLLLGTQFPLYFVLISFILNIGIVYFTFVISNQLVRVLGKAGIKAFSRIAALLLAAIAVNMVLRGLEMLGVLHLTG
jgi:multiple antibiotic resistance protein